MDFELTEEQKMLKTTVRDFLEKEIAPPERVPADASAGIAGAGSGWAFT